MKKYILFESNYIHLAVEYSLALKRYMKIAYDFVTGLKLAILRGVSSTLDQIVLNFGHLYEKSVLKGTTTLFVKYRKGWGRVIIITSYTYKNDNTQEKSAQSSK